MECNKASTSEIGVKKGQVVGIDVLKFIFAFFVMAIHVRPFAGEQFAFAETANFWLQKCICRLAVPFYFASSGFLLFRKLDADDLDAAVIGRYCFKILRLFGIWSVLLAIGGTGHLWYLKATVVAVVCVALCFYWKLKFQHMVLVSVVLYCVGALGDAYYGLVDMFRSFVIVDVAVKGYAYFFNVTRNGLFMGFVFVLMGAGFAQNRFRINRRWALAGLTASLVMLVLEVHALERLGWCKDYNLFLALVPVTFFLFALILQIELPGVRGVQTMRIMGMLIYYLHMLFNTAIFLIFAVIQKIWGLCLDAALFPAVALCTVTAAWIITKLSRTEKFRWLSWLYQ